MKLHAGRVAMSVTAVVAALLLPVATAAPAAAAPPAAESAPGSERVLLAGPAGAGSYVSPLVEPPDVGIESATIVVHYTGFGAFPDAQAAFQRAVDLWEQLIVSPVTIEIDADFSPLPPNVLGSAGPDKIWRNTGCAGTMASTWYPTALANALCNTDLDGFVGAGNSEASATFNSTFTFGGGWYFGLDGNPASDQYDFVTVVMHELGHALGFLGAMNVIGGSGTCCIAGSPLVYDRFTEDDTQPLLSYDSPSTELKNALEGDNGGVFFDGPNTNVANGGTPAPLYAPASWQEGSSYSHLDELAYPEGSPSSLMTPVLAGGEAIHSAGPVTLAMLEDMGYLLPVEPDAPTNVQASEGSNAAKVTFDAPDDGGSAITGYTVTASPGGAVSRGASSPVYVAGLDNDTSYKFTVEAENAFGTGPPSAKSPVDAIPELHGFHPVEPERILDTRYGTSTKCPTCQAIVGARAPQSTTTVQVAGTDGGSGPVPNDGTADAVVMNVTATGGTKPGWLTVWDTGSVPTASNLNFAAGQTVPNLVTVKLEDPDEGGPDPGTVLLGNTVGCACAGTVHVVFDVVGYYSNDGLGAEFESEAPTRILDTRPNDALAPTETREVPIVGGGSPVPMAATAVVMNVTAVSPTKSGWLTVFPSDAPQVPGVSNLNFAAGQTVPNLVTVKLGGDHKVKVNNTGTCACAGSVHVIVDVLGWFGPGAAGGGLNAVTPARILDTRKGVAAANLRTTPLAPQEAATIAVAELGTVPTSGAAAVVVNVTVVAPTANGWLTLWPSGGIPVASNLNFVAGQTVPNLVVVELSPDGTIKIGNTVGSPFAGFTDVIVDVVGWYAPQPS